MKGKSDLNSAFIPSMLCYKSLFERVLQTVCLQLVFVNSQKRIPVSFVTFHIRLVFSMLDYDTENLNSDEIYSSLRGVTEAIEKFSFRSQEDLNEPIKRDGKKDCDIVSIPLINVPR